MTFDLNVMVLCAGLGTRLRPLTYECAKPAVPLLNRPLVGYAFALAKTIGVSEITINTHWLPETMRAAAEQEARALGLRLHVSHEPELLGTGGGLWQARARGMLHRDRDTLILNGDVLFDIDLERIIRTHQESKASATMVLRDMPPGASYSPIETDASGRVHRIGKYGQSNSSTPYLFSGVHVLSPSALDLLPEGESGVIEKVYVPLLDRGERIQAVFERGLWLDLGDPQGYLDAHLELLSGNAALGALERHGILRHDETGRDANARISRTAQLERSSIGAGATIGDGAIVKDSVVWPSASVADGERIERTIVTPKVRVPVS